MNIFRLACCSLILYTFSFCLPVAAYGAQQQQPQSAKTVADKPTQPAPDRTTPVMVEHEGTDTTGARLAFQLKGVFNTSSLFTLTEKDVPKFKVLISTIEEFPSRPTIASAYSVVWAFSQADGTLSFILAREVGLLGGDEVDALVARIAEKTDGLAAKYGYLFAR